MTAEQVRKELEILILRQVAGHIGSQECELRGTGLIMSYAAEREAAAYERCVKLYEDELSANDADARYGADRIRSLKGGVG